MGGAVITGPGLYNTANAAYVAVVERRADDGRWEGFIIKKMARSDTHLIAWWDGGGKALIVGGDFGGDLRDIDQTAFNITGHAVLTGGATDAAVEQWQAGHWITTGSGKIISFDDPDHEQIDIKDIARALSYQCRFTGQTRRFYSVAEHSLWVARLVPQPLRLAALLHDAHEAYIGDINTPLKRAIGSNGELRKLEVRLMTAIEKKFGIEGQLVNLHPTIRRADRIMLMTERDCLLPPPPRAWGVEYEHEIRIPGFDGGNCEPRDAEEEFLRVFKELTT